MSRLTKKSDYGMYFYPECFNDECSGIGTNEKCEVCRFNHEICEKLGEYEDLEEQGRLIKLPCKDGDIIYSVVEDGLTIVELRFSLGFYARRGSDIGKTVFLTKSEAEAKLKELRGGEDE